MENKNKSIAKAAGEALAFLILASLGVCVVATTIKFVIWLF